MTALETGKHYWFRQKVERIWRVCYIAQDPDENQWMDILGVGGDAWEVSKMTLSGFDFQEIDKPRDNG